MDQEGSLRLNVSWHVLVFHVFRDLFYRHVCFLYLFINQDDHMKHGGIVGGSWVQVTS